MESWYHYYTCPAWYLPCCQPVSCGGSGGNRSSRSNGCYRSSGGNGPSRPNGCYRSSGGNGSSRPNRSYRSSGGNGPSRPNGRYRSNGGNGVLPAQRALQEQRGKWALRPNGCYRSSGGNGPSRPNGRRYFCFLLHFASIIHSGEFDSAVPRSQRILRDILYLPMLSILFCLLDITWLRIRYLPFLKQLTICKLSLPIMGSPILKPVSILQPGQMVPVPAELPL